MAKDWPKKKPECQHVQMKWIKAGYYYEGCLKCGEMSASQIVRTMPDRIQLKLITGKLVIKPWEPQGSMYPFPQGLIDCMKNELPTDHVEKYLSRLPEKPKPK